MLDLLDLPKAHDFRVFVVSVGGQDFHGGLRQGALGHLQGKLICTAAEYSFADGRIVRAEGALGDIDIGAGQPEHIFAQTGRLPAFVGATPTSTSRSRC